jgi:hypothetical protein
VADNIKCDPDKCPHNGQRLNNTKSLAARTPNSSSPHNATLLAACREAPKLLRDGVDNSTPPLSPNSIHTTNTLKLGSHNTTSVFKNAESTRVSTPQPVKQSNSAGKGVGHLLQGVLEASHSGDTSLATNRDDFLTSVDGMEEGFSPHMFDATVDLTDPFNIDAPPFSDHLACNSGTDFDNIGVFEPSLPNFAEQSLEPEVSSSPLNAGGGGGGSLGLDLDLELGFEWSDEDDESRSERGYAYGGYEETLRRFSNLRF